MKIRRALNNIPRKTQKTKRENQGVLYLVLLHKNLMRMCLCCIHCSGLSIRGVPRGTENHCGEEQYDNYHRKNPKGILSYALLQSFLPYIWVGL